MNGSNDSQSLQPVPRLDTRQLSLRWDVHAIAARLAGLLKQWNHNSVTRRQLAEMPDHLRQDVGLSRSQIQNELQKPFWKP